MAAARPPAPGDSPTLRSSLSPSIPLPPPPIPAVITSSKIPNMLPDDPIPEQLLNGGVGRVEVSGLGESEMQKSEGLGDGHDDVDGDDPLMGTDGAGSKRKLGKNLVAERKRRKTTISKLWNIKKMLNDEESRLNRKILKKEATAQDNTTARMVKQMQTKFNIYWKEVYKSACIPIILDPRFKYDLLEFRLSDFGTEGEASTWMDTVKKTMQQLFDDYSKEVFIHSHRESDTQNSQVEDEDDPLADWDRYMRSKRKQSSNELDRYLKEDLHPRKEEVDIIQWWQINAAKYPVLAEMARDILAVPASTVPSESAFSTGGRVVSDYRSSLACSTVEALICLQDWLKSDYEDDDE